MSARLHFFGAAGCVTGACALLETDAAKVLVDCGLFQGSKTLKALNCARFPFRLAAFGKMKKAELARTAAQTLKDTAWLPELLVTPTCEGAFAVTAEGEAALNEAGAQAA